MLATRTIPHVSGVTLPRCRIFPRPHPGILASAARVAVHRREYGAPGEKMQPLAPEKIPLGPPDRTRGRSPPLASGDGKANRRPARSLQVSVNTVAGLCPRAPARPPCGPAGHSHERVSVQGYPSPARSPSPAKPHALGAPGMPHAASPRLCPVPSAHPSAGPVPRVLVVWRGVLWGGFDALHPITSLGDQRFELDSRVMVGVSVSGLQGRIRPGAARTCPRARGTSAWRAGRDTTAWREWEERRTPRGGEDLPRGARNECMARRQGLEPRTF